MASPRAPSTSVSSSYVLPTQSTSKLSEGEEAYDSSTIDSLPSSPSTASFASSTSDAERQWHESLQQLELLLTMVLVPYLGKYFGRRFAYYGWAKWMEWWYPSVQVVTTNKAAARGAGLVEAAL
ncbi:MAG: hypothetical protein M1832_002612 [Thelocarpon impressellum]|nr:MAG: hypothetical protein M1832_002612 [Thelocarpon impressellum]